MTKSLQTTSADPFNASEQDFAYSPIGLFAFRKRYATQIIRGAAKARFRRILRAGLADARTAPYRKFGFTLAEVLITLAVIGIVAAMTIPSMISDYKAKQTVTKLQKIYSVFKNAFELSKVDNGDYETWEWIKNGGNYRDAKYFWETYGFPYLRVSKVCEGNSAQCWYKNTASTQISFILNDGTNVMSWSNASNLDKHMWIYVDLNGKNKPNQEGIDIFKLQFTANPYEIKYAVLDDEGNLVSKASGIRRTGVRFYGENLLTVDECLDPNFGRDDGEGKLSKMSCSPEGNNVLCATAIMLNGWKIPEKYPYKF